MIKPASYLRPADLGPKHMGDTLQDIADAAEALADPHHHVEPRWEWDRNRNRKPLEPHKTTVPGLITQLRELAEEGTAVGGEGARAVPASKAPGAFDAVALVAAITFGAAWRLTNPLRDGGLGLPSRGSAEADLHAIVGAIGQAPFDVQREVRFELRSWQKQAEVITGWEQPPIELVAPCPVVDTDGQGAPCGARGTLLAQRDGSGARCMACGAIWSEDNVGLLLAHVQRYTETSRKAADAARLRVRQAKTEQRQREDAARKARENAA